MNQICPRCKINSRQEYGNYHSSYCRICHNELGRKHRKNNRDKYILKARIYYSENREKILKESKEYYLKYRNKATAKRYGISLVEYEDLLQTANNQCQICRTTETLRVDHDHKTGKVRGILCLHCNSGLGYFKDSQKLLKVAIKYLIRK
mgnify:CR=1 FL=1